MEYDYDNRQTCAEASSVNTPKFAKVFCKVFVFSFCSRSLFVRDLQMQNPNLCKFPKRKQRREEEQMRRRRNKPSERINLKNIFTVKGGIVECFCFRCLFVFFSFHFLFFIILYFFLHWVGKVPKAEHEKVQ